MLHSTSARMGLDKLAYFDGMLLMPTQFSLRDLLKSGLESY